MGKLPEGQSKMICQNDAVWQSDAYPLKRRAFIDALARRSSGGQFAVVIDFDRTITCASVDPRQVHKQKTKRDDD